MFRQRNGRPLDEETILLKELELLTACALSDGNDDVLMPVINADPGINLAIADPKSQNEIDQMDPKDAVRYNNATISEVNGMKSKHVFENTTMDELPLGTVIYQSVVNWTSKTIRLSHQQEPYYCGTWWDRALAISYATTHRPQTYEGFWEPCANLCAIYCAQRHQTLGSLD